MSQLRIFPYVQACSNELEQWIDFVCPTDGSPFYIITLAYDYDFWKRVCTKHPNIRLIVRWWVDATEQQQKLTADPVGAAKEHANNLLSLQIVSEGIAWGASGYNEHTNYGNMAIWPNIDLFQATLYDILHPRGLELLAFGNGVGNLRGRDYVDNFPLTLARYRYYNFHSYSWPNIFNGWADLAGRWEADMPIIRKVRPDAVCIVGEFGLTQLVTNLPDKKDIGYTAVPKSPEQYWNEDLKPFNDKLLEHDAFGIHFMVGAGDHGDHEDGHNWDTMDILPSSYIADRMAELSKLPSIIPQPEVIPVAKPKTARIGNLDIPDLRSEFPSSYPPVSFTEKDFISIHHSVSPDVSAQRIYEEHKSKGWQGIGYNFLVHQSGLVEYVGEINTIRAAVGQISEGNKRGIHICLLGDFTHEHPTQAQKLSTKVLIANIQHAFGWFMPVVPHKIFNGNSDWNTACPGDSYKEWWHEILRAVGD